MLPSAELSVGSLIHLFVTYTRKRRIICAASSVFADSRRLFNFLFKRVGSCHDRRSSIRRYPCSAVTIFFLFVPFLSCHVTSRGKGRLAWRSWPVFLFLPAGCFLARWTVLALPFESDVSWHAPYHDCWHFRIKPFTNRNTAHYHSV